MLNVQLRRASSTAERSLKIDPVLLHCMLFHISPSLYDDLDSVRD